MTERAPTPGWAIVLIGAAALVVAWILGQTIGHVVLVFSISVILALLLNPLVRRFRRLRLPRGMAVLAVFLLMIGVVAGAAALVVNPVRSQVEEIRQNLPAYTDQANRQVERLQRFVDDRGVDVDVKASLGDLIVTVEERASQATDDLLSYSLDILGALITIVIIMVATVYMLLDAPRILRFAQRVGGDPAAAFLRRTERTLGAYLKAQILVSLIIGVSAGWMLWVFGVTGIFPLGATFAVAFTAWVFAMEFVPYVGPILGAVPPVLLALVSSPAAALWVIVGFLVIHQLEGHVVVPKVMGDAVGVHPLVVIFGLLIGEQIAGIPGILIAIPGVVIVKEAVTFGMGHLRPRGTAEEVAAADRADAGLPPEPGPAQDGPPARPAVPAAVPDPASVRTRG